jgi:hypothetical protein
MDISQSFGGKPSRGNWCGRVHSDRQVYYQDATFHAELKYSIYFLAYQRRYAEYLALLDALGVNLNPAIIWNALPWTFVIDWVINVSRWLDQWKVQNMEPIVLIHDALVSQRVVRTSYVNVTYHRDYPNSYNRLPKRRFNALKVTESAYRRQTGLPYVNDAITASGLSLKEISLASALAIVRRKRR